MRLHSVVHFDFQLATIGTTLYDFTGRARDEDIPKAILYFSISDYNIKEVCSERHFCFDSSCLF